MALLHSSNGWTANRNSLNLVDYADIELIFSSSFLSHRDKSARPFMVALRRCFHIRGWCNCFMLVFLRKEGGEELVGADK